MPFKKNVTILMILVMVMAFTACGQGSTSGEHMDMGKEYGRTAW